MTSAYAQNLDRTPANFQQLTPLGFLARTARVFPDHPAIVHGARTHSYAEFYARSRRLASALTKLGACKNDTVSVMLPNVPAMLDAKFGVPMTGAVLHSINTRLDAANIAFMIDHAETKVLITDTEYAKVIGDALSVVYHHRGAYLLCLGNTLAANMGKHPNYLWTLPMFHCDGWLREMAKKV